MTKTFFAGLGAGKGWASLNFILTPDEFPEIFDGLKYSFVVTNGRVESNYEKTSKHFYFQSYKQFFEELLIGQQPLTEKKWSDIENSVFQSVTDDIRKVVFEEIKDNSIPYKLAKPLEPVIHISPLHLFYQLHAEKESLSTAYFNDEGTLGLKLSYPLLITWSSPENTGNYETTETHSLAGRTLFDTLVERIKKKTRKAKVQSPRKLFRPSFWISQDAVSLINKNKYLKKNKLEVM